MRTTRTMLKAIPAALLLALTTAASALARPFEGVAPETAAEIPGGLRNMQAPFSDGAAPVTETVETVVQQGLAIGWVVALVAVTALVAAGIGYGLRELRARRLAYG